MGHWIRISFGPHVLKIPVGSIAFESSNGHRRVQFPPPAFEFTWMDADSTAYCRKGIALADDFDRILLSPVSNGGHIIGDVNSGRACVLAGRDHHRITDRTCTAVLADMIFVFFQEILQRLQHFMVMLKIIEYSLQYK